MATVAGLLTNMNYRTTFRAFPLPVFQRRGRRNWFFLGFARGFHFLHASGIGLDDTALRMNSFSRIADFSANRASLSSRLFIKRSWF